MFSETRYALNGALRVAYRASPPGERDIVFVPNWFTCCEVIPELPSIQGWQEAMTSLGRVIFFDQPGTGASDPIAPGALPTLEQWADSITAVLDDLDSREAGFSSQATALLPRRHYLRRRTPPVRKRWWLSIAMRLRSAARLDREQATSLMVGLWGTGEIQHVLNQDMPWNERYEQRGLVWNAWQPARRRSPS